MTETKQTVSSRSTPMDIETNLSQHAQTIHKRLLRFYGKAQWSVQPPLDELVCTILSQNTNDRNRDAAYKNLRTQYPTWEMVRDAPASEVINAIRSAGLANQKGPRIQEILRSITIEHGSLNLDFLRSMPSEEAHRWLLSLNGVGPKTAAIVLLFSLGIPAFPVDTHIYRVSGRLGLRPPGMNVEQAHSHLAALFHEADYGPAHLNLIRLGREICQARRPDCPACPLRDICNFAQTLPSGKRQQGSPRDA